MTSARNAIAAAVALVAAIVLDPRSAVACAVCFGERGNDWTGGFLLGTILMLALPPLIIVGAVVAIYRSIKRQEARIRERDEQRARQALQHGAG